MMERNWGFILHSKNSVPEERLGETTGEVATSVAIESPELKGSWRKVEA